jgi:5-methylcytosine-specific restriction endonuclease McrA
MTRSLPEWRGRTDDASPPPRVKDRIARKADDCCQQCRRPIVGKLRAEFDHVIPLIIGGENRENNYQMLCSECHATKTKLDVRLKAKVAAVRAKHLGLRPARQKIQSAGFRKAEPQRTASRPIERRS